MLGANLERGTAVSNATSNSFITAVCLQITDPVFHLRQNLILFQPEMPLYHLPVTGNHCQHQDHAMKYRSHT